MKFLSFTLLIFILSFSAQAQEKEGNDSDNKTDVVIRKRPSDEIKTLSGKSSHNGFFMGLSFRYNQNFRGKALIVPGFRMGWIANRRLGLGIEAHGIAPTTLYDNIEADRVFYPTGGYGGMFIEPIIGSNKAIHLTFPIHAGAGWMGYLTDWNAAVQPNKLAHHDVFWYVEPGANLEVNVSKHFRLGFGASYRVADDLDLPNTMHYGFSSFNYSFSFKVGRF